MAPLIRALPRAGGPARAALLELVASLEASEVVADVALLDGDAAVRVEGVKQLGALGATIVEPTGPHVGLLTPYLHKHFPAYFNKAWAENEGKELFPEGTNMISKLLSLSEHPSMVPDTLDINSLSGSSGTAFVSMLAAASSVDLICLPSAPARLRRRGRAHTA